MPMTFVRPALIRVNGNRLTDHNRSELGVNVERIETRQRMANGTMRKYFVADKRTFTVSWTDVPKNAGQTVDGFWSGTEIMDFLETAAGRGTFELRVYGNDPAAAPDVYTVVATEFSHTVKKRWSQWELWDFNLTMEQV